MTKKKWVRKMTRALLDQAGFSLLAARNYAKLLADERASFRSDHPPSEILSDMMRDW